MSDQMMGMKRGKRVRRLLWGRKHVCTLTFFDVLCALNYFHRLYSCINHNCYPFGVGDC